MSTAEEDQAEGRALLPADLTDDFAALRGRGGPVPRERGVRRRPCPGTARPRRRTALRRQSLFSRPSTTRAGSHETRRNITAECVLGLPKEVRR
ncbi:hypothetical protein RFN57_04235 [Streptomyces violaceochromogenes]|uniref:Uncharacterized protein n=1 Tax=Streptomyces violaceochromogenes TaxID=67377 RepID=A0ABU6LQ28_9ACTN|nr:hypothetical protein [Streptomyces violaceochromogenes]MEC7051498.1 hypothetical protein [Streptomyces violaceochromogenes]GHC90594.1 hypothetical protein GCM10010309_72620 [Streptomyces violaceochromogenes]